jgi:hypothetical protein
VALIGVSMLVLFSVYVALRVVSVLCCTYLVRLSVVVLLVASCTSLVFVCQSVVSFTHMYVVTVITLGISVCLCLSLHLLSRISVCCWTQYACTSSLFLLIVHVCRSLSLLVCTSLF